MLFKEVPMKTPKDLIGTLQVDVKHTPVNEELKAEDEFNKDEFCKRISVEKDSITAMLQC